MLPSGRDGEETPAKYCDLVVPFLLDKLGDAPATPEDLRVAVLGGATMMCRGTSALLEIGNRNAAAIVAALNEAGLVPTVLDVGGVQGRTVMVDVGSGRITVKVLRQPDRVFADLTAPTEV
jgi:chemotaxis protein CheD